MVPEEESLIFPPLYESYNTDGIHAWCVHSIPLYFDGSWSPHSSMKQPNLNFGEMAEISMFEALAHDIRWVDTKDDDICEEVCDNITEQHALGVISDEMQRYLFDLFVARRNNSYS